jgi:16S rRNA (cytidine1402-2'-O)-methyltransferase
MSHQQDSSLYVVATPIGNLKDITFRAVEVLSDVDVVVSEHVRKTRNLMKHYCIKTRVVGYREENALRVIPRVLDVLAGGGSVALVAEAGTPGVSDPGRRLVEAVRRAGFRVVPVPGASALVAALSVSGMDDPRFVFEGFLPRRPSKRRKRLEELVPEIRSLVFFEAPHRLLDCLKDMVAVLGDRRCLVAREITKLHEEITKERLSAFIDRFSSSQPKGEFVIVCEGSTAAPVAGIDDRALQEVKALVKEGIKKHKAARAVARRYGIKADDLYRLMMSDAQDSRKGNGA